MRHQPARRFRDPHPHQEDDDAKRGADQEGGAPAEVTAEHRRIEQHDRADRPDRGADPEAAVDHEVGPAAVARRDQLLDGGIDGGVFAADAGAGDEAADHERPQIPGERGRGGGDEIDRERDEEQLLAAEAVGEPAEKQRAQHRAGDIGAGGDADVGVGELQDRAVLERARHRAGERHFQAVENPGDAERGDHQGMEAAPGQPVEPGGNVGIDDRRRRLTFRIRHEIHAAKGLLRSVAIRTRSKAPGSARMKLRPCVNFAAFPPDYRRQ